ncbi:hypothetical protein [Brazilian marseillevirus]|uniref:hypothetical protein n=1 Tax=Brazilian marseillevirus TaxID=1813599 RepID=UPI0007804A92|nr:hypothetical protein A3303_gp042 [Brazilian marseillevirus]AMQ10550.1 hypothetical protein [Brazilian marseillevirus]
MADEGSRSLGVHFKQFVRVSGEVWRIFGKNFVNFIFFLKIMKVSLSEAKRLAKKLGVDLEVVPLQIWRYAVEVETEHLETVDCDMLTVAKVALDHLLEYGPPYYAKLREMEEDLEKYWKGKKMPNVLLPGKLAPKKCVKH